MKYLKKIRGITRRDRVRKKIVRKKLEIDKLNTQNLTVWTLTRKKDERSAKLI